MIHLGCEKKLNISLGRGNQYLLAFYIFKLFMSYKFLPVHMKNLKEKTLSQKYHPFHLILALYGLKYSRFYPLSFVISWNP